MALKLPAKIFLFLQKMNLRTLYFKPSPFWNFTQKCKQNAVSQELNLNCEGS